jgi:hypothetical protein
MNDLFSFGPGFGSIAAVIDVKYDLMWNSGMAFNGRQAELHQFEVVPGGNDDGKHNGVMIPEGRANRFGHFKYFKFGKSLLFQKPVLFGNQSMIDALVNPLDK